MSNKLIIYHGSPNNIEKPKLGLGNPHNDYGLGFYCTLELELAKEWACSADSGGFANRYLLDVSKLRTLNLSSGEYSILSWLSVLLNNREFRIASDIAAEARDYLLQEFLPEYEQYDVIMGYRADDSYFSFARAFLNNTLSLAQLEKAMFLGRLGQQIVLKSESAFAMLQYQGYEIAEQTEYFPRRMARDQEARRALAAERRIGRATDAVYMIDILRGEWKKDDPRIRRVIS